MSRTRVETACLLLRDHFGPLVAGVGGVLLRGGPLPLPVIVFRSKIGLNKIKQALVVLVQQGFVEFGSASAEEKQRHVEYRCVIDRVLLLSRYPQYMLLAKKLHGEAAELIVEELLAHGQLSLSKCVQNVTKRLEAIGESGSIKPEDVKHQFVVLVESRFICRCPEVVAQPDDATVPSYRRAADSYVLPDAVDIYGAGKAAGVSSQRKRPPDVGKVEPDAGILWRVNFDRIHECLRDQYLLGVARNRIDTGAEEVLRAALRFNELRASPGSGQSVPLQFTEIMKLIPESANLVKSQVEQYFSLLCDDKNRMVTKTGENAGGTFVVDFSNAMKMICRSTVQSIIQEKYGSKAVRVFNLLLEKGYLEQNEIETFAMLPSKEGKELTFRLLADNILYTKEVPRTNDFAPSRTFYLFRVNLPNVVRMLCDRSYKAISNLILRRCHENEEHKSLLERQERLDAVIANIRADAGMSEELKEQHIHEAEDVYLNLAERETLEKYRKNVAALHQAETEIDESILIFNLYKKFVS